MQRSVKQLAPILLKDDKRRQSNIAELSKNLFDKIGSVQNENLLEKQGESGTFFNMSDKLDKDYDSLAQLLSKAQSISNSNQAKITEARKKKALGMGKQNTNMGTFMTGTGLYETEKLPEKRTEKSISRQDEMPETYSTAQILKDLMKNEEYDDLSELRRMIKETDQNIAVCQKKVAKTHKNIMNYVGENYETQAPKSQIPKSKSTRLQKNRFK